MIFLKKHGAHFDEKYLWDQLRPIIPYPTGRFFRGTLSQALRARLRSVLSLRDALADISQQHLARGVHLLWGILDWMKMGAKCIERTGGTPILLWVSRRSGSGGEMRRKSRVRARVRVRFLKDHAALTGARQAAT